MRYLYIDTSASYLYSSIIENGDALSVIIEEYGQSLSEVALPRIVSMFEDNNLEGKDIDKIIVVNGPGSFTGIRVGLTIAKVFAWGLNIPISTILSLEAMAISSKTNKYHVPLIDARRGYVYAAIYDKDNNEILKPSHIKLDILKKELEKINDYEIISNDEFEDFKNISPYKPNMVKMVEHFKDKKPIPSHLVNPEYLKLTEAEEKNDKRNN